MCLEPRLATVKASKEKEKFHQSFPPLLPPKSLTHKSDSLLGKLRFFACKHDYNMEMTIYVPYGMTLEPLCNYDGNSQKNICLAFQLKNSLY